MTDDAPGTGPQGELLDSEAAAKLLGVPLEELQRLVDADILLTTPSDADGPRFLREDVDAVRLLGS
jgi:hypothetical protein